MGFLKRKPIDWDKLSDVIIEQLRQIDWSLSLEEKGSYYYYCLVKCDSVREMFRLADKDIHRYQLWDECGAIYRTAMFYYYNRGFDIEKHLLLRARVMATTISYWHQFLPHLEKGMSSTEFILILYKAVLRKKGVACQALVG